METPARPSDPEPDAAEPPGFASDQVGRPGENYVLGLLASAGIEAVHAGTGAAAIDLVAYAAGRSCTIQVKAHRAVPRMVRLSRTVPLVAVADFVVVVTHFLQPDRAPSVAVFSRAEVFEASRAIADGVMLPASVVEAQPAGIDRIAAHLSAPPLPLRDAGSAAPLPTVAAMTTPPRQPVAPAPRVITVDGCTAYVLTDKPLRALAGSTRDARIPLVLAHAGKPGGIALLAADLAAHGHKQPITGTLKRWLVGQGFVRLVP